MRKAVSIILTAAAAGPLLCAAPADVLAQDEAEAPAEDKFARIQATSDSLGFGSKKPYSEGAADTAMDSSSIALSIGGAVTVQSAGGGQAHNNMQPYLAVRFCIALQGLFPSRN